MRQTHFKDNHFKLSAWNMTSALTEPYLASDLVTVYSNHKMLGIKLVSRTRKYSDIGLLNVTKSKNIILNDPTPLAAD